MRANLKDKKPEETGKGGEKIPLPGRYHVAVKSIDTSHLKHPTSIPTEFEILAGTTPGQEGKATTEFFYFDPKDPKEWAIDRLTRFAWAAGLINPGEEKDIDLQDAVGRQLVISLEANEYEKNGEKKTGVKISRDGGMWPLGHAEVSDVPIDSDAASLASAPQTAGASASSGASAAQPSSIDPFEGL